MNCYEEVLKWSKKMGYPKADCAFFQANLRKLTPVQMKIAWLHLVRHVRPANEVSAIRKRLLVYKLTAEGNPTQERLDKFESVSDYEAYLKGKELEGNIKYLDAQIENTKRDIGFVFTKSKSCGDGLYVQSVEEKDKVEKTRLLKMKRLELEQQINHFKGLNNLMANFVHPVYSCSSECETPLSQELKDFLQSLPPGQQIKQMSEHLQRALATEMTALKSDKLPGPSTEDEEFKMFYNALVENFDSQITQLEKLQRMIGEKRMEIDAKKKEIIEKLTSSPDLNQRSRAGVIQTFFKSGHLEKAYNEAEAKFLSDWLSENGTSFTEQPSNWTFSTELEDEISELNCSVAESIKDILSCSRFPAESMRVAIEESFAKMRSNTAACLPRVETFSSVVHRLVLELPQLIELFLKIPSSSSVADKSLYNSPDRQAKGVGRSDESTERFLSELMSKTKDEEGESLGPQIERKIAERLGQVARSNDELNSALMETELKARNVSELLDGLEKYQIWKILPQKDFQASLARISNSFQKLSSEQQRQLLASIEEGNFSTKVF